MYHHSKILPLRTRDVTISDRHFLPWSHTTRLKTIFFCYLWRHVCPNKKKTTCPHQSDPSLQLKLCFRFITKAFCGQPLLWCHIVILVFPVLLWNCPKTFTLASVTSALMWKMLTVTPQDHGLYHSVCGILEAQPSVWYNVLFTLQCLNSDPRWVQLSPTGK